MSGSANFQSAAWEVSDGDRYSLLRITIPGATAITVGTKQVVLDGIGWDPLLGDTTTQAPGAFLTSDPAFGDLKAHITNGHLSAYSGQSLARVLADHPISGCVVELWFLDDSVTTLDPATGAYRAFVGAVEEWELGADGIKLSAIQRTDFNGTVAPTFINRRDYPQSPDEAVDVAIPVLFGECRGLPLRFPFPSQYPVEQRVGELLWGGNALLKGILVDTGRGSASKAKALVASHMLKQVGIADANLGPFGTSIFLEQDGKFDAMVSDPADIVNAAKEAGITIPDSSGAALKGLTPTDIRIIPNYAEEPRAVLDPRETRWAILNQSQFKRFLLGKLPTPSPPGIMTHIYSYIRYFTDASFAGGHFQLARAGTFSTFSNLTPTTTPIYHFLDHGSAWNTGAALEVPTTPWDFGECELQVDVSGFAGTGSLYVIDMGVVIQYEPGQDLVSAAKTVNEIRHRPGFKLFGAGIDAFDYPDPHRVREVAPAVSEFKGKFYFNGIGWRDGTETGQSAGAFTGVANATIERPGDLAAFLLAKYGGESFPSAFEFGGGVGSFAARSLLQCWDGDDMRLGFAIADTQDVATTLAKIADASGSWVFLDESTDTWRILPWRTGMPATYGRRLNRHDLLGDDPISVAPVPKTKLLTGLTIPYLWDDATESFLGQVSAATGVADSRSCAGYLYSNIRDQDLGIRADVDDRFQIMVNSGLWTWQFHPGSGRDWVLNEIFGMNNGNQVGFAGAWWSGAFGGYIPSFGCKLWAWNAADSAVKVTLTGGSFTMAGVAASVQADLRAQTGDSRYTVTFNAGTGKYTMARGGTAFRVWFQHATDTVNSAAAILGIRTGDYNTTSIVSDVAMAKDCLTITASLAFNILWRTGTFGITGASGLKNVAHLWGFEGQYDSGDGGLNGTTIFSYTGLCPKGGREAALNTAASRYFLKRDSTVEGRYIRDTKTALELRNRLIDLLSVQRLVVKWTTGTVVDLGRGEVVEVSGDWDAFIPCPAEGSGGTWDGVRLVVVETQKRAGNAGWVADIVAVQI